MTTNPFQQPGFEQQTQQSEWEYGSGAPSYQTMGGPPQRPLIDVVDNTMNLWVFVDLPGFQIDEIHVRGDETTLMISADRPAEIEEGRNVVVQERPQHIERTVQLPTTVDVSEADLSYEDGVCKIMLPKAASERFTELEFDDDD